MSAEPFLSEIQLFPINFAPRNWAMCNGQLLPINQNQALFSLLGTTYGGDGRTTFALPDLRGRSPMHVGNGHILGEKGGVETVALTEAQLPAHTHTIDISPVTLTAHCRNAAGDQRTPVAGAPAVASGPDPVYTQSPPDTNMAAGTVVVGGAMAAAPAGGGAAHENRQPYLVLTYCIALSGIFPSPN
jgi:microcystin-dependent protein